MKLKFYFQNSIASNSVQVFIIGEDQYNKRYIAEPMVLKFSEIDVSKSHDPSLIFSGEIATMFFPALVAGLAECGYTYESSEKGELKATKEHLNDMRKLVFK